MIEARDERIAREDRSRVSRYFFIAIISVGFPLLPDGLGVTRGNTAGQVKHFSVTTTLGVFARNARDYYDKLINIFVTVTCRLAAVVPSRYADRSFFIRTCFYRLSPCVSHSIGAVTFKYYVATFIQSAEN